MHEYIHKIWPLRINRFLLLRAGWARICKHFKEPRNRFPAWRACTTTPFVVLTRTRTGYKGWQIPGNRFMGSLNVYKYGLCILGPSPGFISSFYFLLQGIGKVPREWIIVLKDHTICSALWADCFFKGTVAQDKIGLKVVRLDRPWYVYRSLMVKVFFIWPYFYLF